MITTEQAREYLDTVGVSMPDFILAAFVEHNWVYLQPFQL